MMRLSKYNITILFFFSFLYSGILFDDGLLDGRTFYGKAIEVTPESQNYPAKLWDEVISFENGKVNCEFFKEYNIKDCFYSAAIDGRRAIMVEVISFNAFTTTERNGKILEIEFSGDVFARTKLSAVLKVSSENKIAEEYSIVSEIR